MSANYIGMVSLTYAYKAKNVLSTYGLQSKIVNTPKTGRSKGCGYSLAVEGSYGEAVDILRHHGIDFID